MIHTYSTHIYILYRILCFWITKNNFRLFGPNIFVHKYPTFWLPMPIFFVPPSSISLACLFDFYSLNSLQFRSSMRTFLMWLWMELCVCIYEVNRHSWILPLVFTSIWNSSRYHMHSAHTYMQRIAAVETAHMNVLRTCTRYIAWLCCIACLRKGAKRWGAANEIFHYFCTCVLVTSVLLNLQIEQAHVKTISGLVIAFLQFSWNISSKEKLK